MLRLWSGGRGASGQRASAGLSLFLEDPLPQGAAGGTSAPYNEKPCPWGKKDWPAREYGLFPVVNGGPNLHFCADFKSSTLAEK